MANCLNPPSAIFPSPWEGNSRSADQAKSAVEKKKGPSTEYLKPPYNLLNFRLVQLRVRTGPKPDHHLTAFDFNDKVGCALPHCGQWQFHFFIYVPLQETRAVSRVEAFLRQQV